MHVTLSLPKEKTALFLKLVEEGAFNHIPIVGARLTSAGSGQTRAVYMKGKAMSELSDGQIVYRKATSAHKMTAKPMLRKGYRLVGHLAKANKK